MYYHAHSATYVPWFYWRGLSSRGTVTRAKVARGDTYAGARVLLRGGPLHVRLVHPVLDGAVQERTDADAVAAIGGDGMDTTAVFRHWACALEAEGHRPGASRAPTTVEYRAYVNRGLVQAGGIASLSSRWRDRRVGIACGAQVRVHTRTSVAAVAAEPLPGDEGRGWTIMAIHGLGGGNSGMDALTAVSDTSHVLVCASSGGRWSTTGSALWQSYITDGTGFQRTRFVHVSQRVGDRRWCGNVPL